MQTLLGCFGCVGKESPDGVVDRPLAKKIPIITPSPSHVFQFALPPSKFLVLLVMLDNIKNQRKNHVNPKCHKESHDCIHAS